MCQPYVLDLHGVNITFINIGRLYVETSISTLEASRINTWNPLYLLNFLEATKSMLYSSQ